MVEGIVNFIFEFHLMIDITDHARGLNPNQNLNDYLEALIGAQFRRVPTILYGCSDEFLNHLLFGYTFYKNEAGNQMREPPCRLGVHVKYYVGCTFKTLIDL